MPAKHVYAGSSPVRGIWAASLMDRQRSSKPLYPGSSPGRPIGGLMTVIRSIKVRWHLPWWLRVWNWLLHPLRMLGWRYRAVRRAAKKEDSMFLGG